MKPGTPAVEPSEFTARIIAAANGALLPGAFVDGMAQVLGIANEALKAVEERRVRYLTPPEKREARNGST